MKKPNTQKVLRALEEKRFKRLLAVVVIGRKPLHQREQKLKKRSKRKQVPLNSHERKRERSKRRKAGLRFFKSMVVLRVKLRWVRVMDSRNKKLHDYLIYCYFGLLRKQTQMNQYYYQFRKHFL